MTDREKELLVALAKKWSISTLIITKTKWIAAQCRLESTL